MAAVQKGTELSIGFGSFAYTGYVASDVTVTYPNGNVETIPDADGATMTKILMDPSAKIEADVVILAAGSIDPPIDGATVTLTPPSGESTNYMSEGSSAKHSVGATKLSLSLIAEDSMTYS